MFVQRQRKDSATPAETASNEKNAYKPLARLAATMEATNKTRAYIVTRIGAGDKSGHFSLLQLDKSSEGTWDVTLYNPINYQDENNQDMMVLRHRLISAGFKIQNKICCRSLYLQAGNHDCGPIQATMGAIPTNKSYSQVDDAVYR